MKRMQKLHASGKYEGHRPGIYKGDGNQELGLFPENFHWVVFTVTLSWRLYHVTQKINWWILHPDEVFQTLEGKIYIL